MSIDLSNLKLIEEQIEVDFDAYVDPSEFAPPVPEGIYLFKQGKPTFTATSEGRLGAEFTHTIVGGPQDGKILAFDRVSNKRFKRSGVWVNMMVDQLRALGDFSRPASDQEYANQLAAAEGKPFQASVQWEAGCNHKDTPQACEWADKNKVFRIRGSRNFPEASNGERLPEAACAICGAKVSARAKINNRIPAVQLEREPHA